MAPSCAARGMRRHRTSRPRGRARGLSTLRSTIDAPADFFPRKIVHVTEPRMPVLQLRRDQSNLRTALPEEGVRATPFLKWVGGKPSLLPDLLRHAPPPAALRRYHEPFVGG